MQFSCQKSAIACATEYQDTAGICSTAWRDHVGAANVLVVTDIVAADRSESSDSNLDPILTNPRCRTIASNVVVANRNGYAWTFNRDAVFLLGIYCVA